MTDRNISSGNRVLIVADDLTGACDAAVAFSSRSLQAEVVPDWRSSGVFAAQVIAISTESRDVPVKEAVESLNLVAQESKFRCFEHLFKKIDSVFRGNTFEEIVVTLKAFEFDLAIMAPAYPALGRTSRDGNVKVSDISGEYMLAIYDRLVELGLEPCHIAVDSSPGEVGELLQACIRDGRRLVYFDAISDADLEVAVRGGRELDARILWIGSAGLAHALASALGGDREVRMPQGLSAGSGSVIFFVGSDHPVSLRQVRALREQVDVTEVVAELPAFAGHEQAGVFVVPIRPGFTREVDICTAVKGFSPEKISCLFMTGGDTAALVCRALGIQSFQLQDEFEAGLPRAIAVGGAFAGCNVILKSGGFGKMDVLCRIAAVFHSQFPVRSEVAN